MNTNVQCPTPEELRQLLEQSLSGEQQDRCTGHLDGCTCCQQKLEEMATEGSNISQMVDHIPVIEPMATSAYWPALHALESEGGSVVVAADSAVTSDGVAKVAVRSRNRSLDFLQPASDPAFLGRLAQFDVMRVLGQGGMGVVVEAFDTRLQRNVAIKILDPNLAEDDIARQRFCREARAAASVTHENVVAVHQVEKASEDGLPYLVMQLVAGESLEQYIQRVKQLSMREIVRIGMQASQGLAAAHAQGLIHRDIKPGNILLEQPSGNVKISDFGLARVADDTKLTRTGFVTGTPLYMAPEQALGGEPDARSDLFSLGAVLYEMCAGQPPFTGSSAPVILKQIVEARQQPLRELNPSVPEWLSGTIDRLLAKKPDDRIQSAAHLAELFEFEWALMKTTSEDVPNVCQVAQKQRVKRNRLVAATVGGSFLILGLLGGRFLLPRAGTVPTATPNVVGAAPASPAPEPLAVFGANAGSVRSVSFNPSGDTVAMAVEDGTVRLWDWSAKSVKSTISAHRGTAWALCFSHHGELLATAGDDGQVKLWSLSQPEPVATFDNSLAVRSLAFSPDDRTIYAGDSGGGVRAWSLNSARPTAEAKLGATVYTLAVSPDGQTLAVAGTDKVVRLLNAKTLTQKLVLEGHSGPIHGLAFDRDGKHLASGGWDKTLRVWDVGSGQLVKSWPAHEDDIFAVAYSPDGTRLASGGIEGAVKLWNAETGELLATYRGPASVIHSVAFSPDGKLLAGGGSDGAVKIWKMP